MKPRSIVALVVAVALIAAAPAAGARLDPSFGRGGSYAVSTPKYDGGTAFTRMHLAVAPGGGSYVQQGSWILAFGANGKPYLGFGERGRLLVAPTAGKLEEVGDIAVDSGGRVLVTGSLEPVSVPGHEGVGAPPRRVTEAFVIRYMPDGSLDPTFGSGGEIDTTFGVPPPIDGDRFPGAYGQPSVAARRIEVDTLGRLVVAGDAVVSEEACLDTGTSDQAFLARLNPDGSIDTSFGGVGTGYFDIDGEFPTALTATPAGGWAALAGPICSVGPHDNVGLPAELSVLDEAGTPLTSLDAARRPFRAGPAFAIDQEGRIVYAEQRPKHEVPARVFRLLANGDPDTSFGQGGSVGLGRVGGEYVGALAIDKRGRVVVGFGATQLAVTRLAPSGRIEASFGRNGALQTKLPGTSLLEAMALDPQGRILAAGQIWTGSLRNNKGVAVARFLPGS